MPAIPKYRPALTEDQISHIIALCEMFPSSQSKEILSSLAPFKTKISIGAKTPSHVSAPKQSLFDAMGLTDVNPPALYKVWSENPEFPFTKRDMEAINTYRYANDLMSPEEEKEYESNTSIG